MISRDLRGSGFVRPLCNLHVCHPSPEGGICRWARDFSQSDPFSENLILESVFRTGLPIVEYHLVDGRTGRLVDSSCLRSTSGKTEVSPVEYRALVGALCRSHGIKHLYVSSLTGHRPELVELGLPVTIIHHDHQPCRELRDRYLQASASGQVTQVAPSQSLVQAIRRVDPRFWEISFVVIENGADAAPDCFGGATDDRRLRVAVLDDLELNQGSGLLSQSFEAVRLFADLYLVGSGDFGRCFEGRWGITVVSGNHQEDALTRILRDISPDLGILLSTVPRGYTYGLLDLRMRGIPPMAMCQGSYGDLISHGVDGFLYPPDGSALVTLLVRLDARREEVRLIARHLRRQSLPAIRQMVYRYYSLRHDLPRELDRILAGRRRVEVQP